jgi:hypothetical protein
MFDLSFFPLPPSSNESPTWDIIEHILLETGGGTIELRRRTEEELSAAPLGTSVFQILQPFTGDCNDYMAQTLILEHITHIVPDSVEDMRPADLSEFGLDTPYRLTVTAGEWAGTLLIGRRDAERGGRFVMIEGYDAVLFDPNGNYSFLHADPTQVRSQSIWLHNINTVSSVTFGLEGTVRVLRLEHDHEEETLQGWLDDIELSETNARRLYMAALRIGQNGGTDAPKPGGSPDYSATIHFLDGSNDMLELYRINDSEFLIVHNGENTNLFITRMTLQQSFLSRFEILDRGEDIPRL